jgi:hypothetical protein
VGADPGSVLDGLMATMGRYKEMSGISGNDDVGGRIDATSTLSAISITGHAVRFYNIGRALFEVQKKMFNLYRELRIVDEKASGTPEFESCVQNVNVLKNEVSNLERQLLKSLKEKKVDLEFTPAIRKRKERKETFDCTFFGTHKKTYQRTIRNLAALCVDNDNVYDEMVRGVKKDLDAYLKESRGRSEGDDSKLFAFHKQYEMMYDVLDSTDTEVEDSLTTYKEHFTLPPQLTLWRLMFGYAFPEFEVNIAEGGELDENVFAEKVGRYDSKHITITVAKYEAEDIDLWQFLGPVTDSKTSNYSVSEVDFRTIDNNQNDGGMFIPIGISDNAYTNVPSANGRPTEAALENELDGGDDYGASWQRDVFEKRVHQWEDHVYRLVMKIAGYCNIEQQTLLSMDLSVQEKEALVDMRQKLRAAEAAFTAEMAIVKSIMTHVVDNSDVIMSHDGTSALTVRSHSVVVDAVRDATTAVMERQQALQLSPEVIQDNLKRYTNEGGLARQIKEQIDQTDSVTMEALSAWAEKKMKNASEKLDVSIRRIRADKNSRTPSWAMSAEMGGFVEFSPKLYWAVSELPVWIKRSGFDQPDAKLIEGIIRQNEHAKATYASDIEEKHTLLSAMIGTIVNFREQKNPRNYVSATQQSNVLESRLLMQIQALMYTWHSRTYVPQQQLMRNFQNGRQTLYENAAAQLTNR